MKVGFIEVENQMGSGFGEVDKKISDVSDQLQCTSRSIADSLEKFSGNIEKGFLAVEGAMGEDVNELKSEIESIKKRPDDANID